MLDAIRENLHAKSEYYLITYSKQNSSTIRKFIIDNLLNTFQSNVAFLHPLKTTENIQLSDVFRERTSEKFTIRKIIPNY